MINSYLTHLLLADENGRLYISASTEDGNEEAFAALCKKYEEKGYRPLGHFSFKDHWHEDNVIWVREASNIGWVGAQDVLDLETLRMEQDEPQ